MDKVSYALGLGIGHQLMQMGASDLNIDDFAEATGCGRDVSLWREKARRNFPDADDQTVAYQMRLPGFLAERLISAYITTHLNYYK